MSDENRRRVAELIARGVQVPVPGAIEIAPDVDPDRVAAGVTLHAGSRLRGPKTWIGPDATIGSEAPMTLVDCRVGADVALAGGFASGATFLDGATIGSGAHIRPGCLLEERASAAHTVGLKQTILFPYVTLGSLINFCDCLMAGGSGPKAHSEVGSSYIHFNFTPHQDKATASLFGDVARGVMLDQRPIFLGGQGGTVGPARVGYGAIVPAGTVLRRDVADGDAIVGQSPPGRGGPFVQGCYRSVERIVVNNVVYLGNLIALREWYRQVRVRCVGDAFRPLHDGALEVLESALAERVTRFRSLAAKMAHSVELAEQRGVDATRIAQQRQLGERAEETCNAIEQCAVGAVAESRRDALLDGFDASGGYLDAVTGLSPDARSAGERWLESIVDAVREAAGSTLDLFVISR